MATKAPTQVFVETKRLLLRGPTLSDAPDYVAIFTNPKNIEFDPQANGPDEATVEKYEAHLAESIEGNGNGTKAMWTVCLKNDDGTPGPVIGMGGFPWLPANADGRAGNTGALIDSNFARKGYATEALVATLDYGFDQLGFDNIEQDTEEINTPYRGLMKALGFDRYGQRQEPDKSGLVRWIYSVDKAQWQELKQQLAARQP